MWTTRKVKRAQLLTKEDVLATPAPGVVTVYQLRDSTRFINHAVAKSADSDGVGWLSDMNHESYVPLTSEGLDACCIGGATFAGVVKAFTLTNKEAEANAKQQRTS